MLGKDIVIDREKCDGCGLCVQACHEGALAIVDGKAALVRKDFCDGLGDCLPACPQGAISFADRQSSSAECGSGFDSGYQWPIQLALIPPRWDFYRGTIVIAADCTAFVMDRFRSMMAKGDPVIIGCLFLFSLGVAFLLATAYVFFGDIKHLYSVVLQLSAIVQRKEQERKI